MNNSIKEAIGVGAVMDEVLKNPLLKGEIPLNDKTVSWDGEIQVYNEKNHKKSALYGRVPVQVKSKQVKSLSNDKIKFRLYRDDLQNYYHDGGVIFFVVELVDSKRTRVYYDALLPIDLKKVIENMKKQNSIYHEFSVLPSEDGALDIICKNFIINSRKQTQNVLDINVSDLKRNGGFVIPTVSLEFSTIFNYPTYIYSTEEHYNLEIPIDRIHIRKIIEETELEIKVNGKTHYTNATRRIEKDKTTIGFGKSFKLDILRGTSDDDNNIRLNFTRAGSLAERIKDTKFMKAVLIAKCIEVMGAKIPIESSKEDLIADLRNHVKELEELEKVFGMLNFSFDQPFDNLKEIDYRNIERLKDILLYRDYSDIKLEQSGFLTIEFGGITILLSAIKDNNEWGVFNAFDSEKLFRIVASEDKAGPGSEVSSYTMLAVNQLFKMANFNLKELEKSILKINYDTDFARQYINRYLLEVINYYDEEDQNEEFLDFAKNAFEHLVKFEEGNNENDFLNIMQIIRRQRDFSREEFVEIISRKNKATDTFVICGYLALLGNLAEFDYYFNQLSDEDRDEFSSYPIYRLVGSLKDG